VLPQLIRGFQERFPGVRLETAEGTAAECQVRLRDGASDLALLYDYALDADMVHHALYAVAPSVVLPSDHPLAGDEAVDLAALASEPLILFDVAPASRNTAEIFAAAGIEPHIARRTTNFELVRALVARGLGYSVLLQTPRAPVSYEGLPLVTRPIRGETRRTDVVLAWAGAGRPSRRTAFLLGSCVDLLSPSN
jgi:DNA-binding transcriptional LysR family regulator